jgi:hypothetical protein
MSAFILKLESVASPNSLGIDLQDLVNIAKRLDLTVKAEMNGYEVLASPNTNVDDLHFVLMRAMETRSRIGLLTELHVGHFLKVQGKNNEAD